jgi:hypothetical protein
VSRISKNGRPKFEWLKRVPKEKKFNITCKITIFNGIPVFHARTGGLQLYPEYVRYRQHDLDEISRNNKKVAISDGNKFLGRLFDYYRVKDGTLKHEILRAVQILPRAAFPYASPFIFMVGLVNKEGMFGSLKLLSPELGTQIVPGDVGARECKAITGQQNIPYFLKRNYSCEILLISVLLKANLPVEIIKVILDIFYRE